MEPDLSRIPLFAGLPPERLAVLGRRFDRVRLAPGEVLFREDEPGEHLYVVDDGELEVLRAAGKPEELLLRVLGPGEYFGDMALIQVDGLRTATIRARGPAVLRSLSRTEFDRLLAEFPRLARAMVRVLTERLDASNTSAFRDLTEKNRQLQKAYDDLRAAHLQIVEKERLEKELSVAADIQRSILPDQLLALPGVECGAFLRPARHVGGDFYDVFQLDAHRLGILVGDVADKGVPSAIYMARVHAFLVAEADREPDPGAVLRAVNARITRLERNAQFVTVLYGTLDLRTREFRYARAGHTPPLVVSPDGRVRSLPMTPGMAIGVLDEIVLDEQSLPLEPGSLLVGFTDGLTDCRNPDGIAFGMERVLAFWGRDEARNSAAAGCAGLDAVLESFRAGAAQDDDVTVVAVRVSECRR